MTERGQLPHKTLLTVFGKAIKRPEFQRMLQKHGHFRRLPQQNPNMVINGKNKYKITKTYGYKVVITSHYLLKTGDFNVQSDESGCRSFQNRLRFFCVEIAVLIVKNTQKSESITV